MRPNVVQFPSSKRCGSLGGVGMEDRCMMTDGRSAAKGREARIASSRRRFLKRAATALLGGTAALAAPNVSRAATTTLKLQTSWGATSPFQDFARDYVRRAEEMSGRRLRIDLLPSGAVAKAFQVQDAVHKGILDGAHTVPAYWYSKSKTAALFGTGPCWGWDSNKLLGWIAYGGGRELYRELMRQLGLNIVGFFAGPMPAQPFGWFRKPIRSLRDVEGLKFRTVGLATDVLQQMGMMVTQLPGSEIMPALEIGVIEAFEFNNPLVRTPEQ